MEMLSQAHPPGLTPQAESLMPQPPAHLHGRALGRQGCETHDVTEVDGDAVKGFGLDRLPALQLLSHRAVGSGQEGHRIRGPGRAGREVCMRGGGGTAGRSLRQNLVEQGLGLALLLQVGLGALLHQLL